MPIDPFSSMYFFTYSLYLLLKNLVLGEKVSTINLIYYKIIIYLRILFFIEIDSGIWDEISMGRSWRNR